MSILQVVLSLQGAYFLFTGIWPIFSIGTFEIVTGPKTDKWLVKTVGLMIAIIGATIGVAALRGSPGPEIVGMALASAAGLAGVDVIYVFRGRIARIYLLDAAAEVVLIAAILVALAFA